MKCLVTGCAGFIGWKVSEMLLSKGYDVIGIDNLNSYYDVKLKNWRLEQLKKFDNFRFYKVDMSDYDSLKRIFLDNKFDCIYNLAAMAGVRYSILKPKEYLKTNIEGTLNILELMKEYNIKKMVLASTSSIYAGHEGPFKEDMCVNTPISPYAASKKSAEVLAYTYHYLYGMDISVVRYFTVYGPAGRPDMSIFRFIKLIDESKPVKIYGDGTQTRDFTYIDDIANGTILASKDLGYEIINLGNGKEPVQLKRVISLIEHYLGKEADIEYENFHKADMKETMADITKARSLLGWEPKIDIEKGIKLTIDWYISNRSWLSKVKI